MFEVANVIPVDASVAHFQILNTETGEYKWLPECGLLDIDTFTQEDFEFECVTEEEFFEEFGNVTE